jgi:hypothetical protein
LGPARLILPIASGLVALIACAAIPEYAVLKGDLIDPGSVGMSDVISYRTITRADFKGERPPPAFAPHIDRLGAVTCAQVITGADTQLSIQPARSPDGKTIYRARPHHLRFHARMDRRCSWWNPRDVGLPQDYILEHEQIHFALFELEARRLNTSIQSIAARIQATAPSPEEAAQLAWKQLEGHVRERLDEIFARSRRFDQETSMGHNPVQQKRWWKRVQSELAATRN